MPRRAQRLTSCLPAAAAVLLAALSYAAPASAVTGWHTVATPNPGTDFAYQNRNLGGVVAFSAANAWAVGSYQVNGSGARPLLVHWTGTAWHVVSPPAPAGGSGSLRFVAARGASDIWALGAQQSAAPGLYLLHYNGSSWHAASTAGIAATFLAWSLCVGSAGNVWIAGYDSATQKPVAEHWNGSTWTSSAPPLPAGATGGQISGMTIIPGTGRPMAVGYYLSASATQLPYAARWTGSAWHPMSTPTAVSAQLRAVVMTSATNAWAVGTRYPDPTTFQTYTVRWTGGSWAAVASRNRSGVSNTLLGATATGPKDVWAVGYSTGCSGACYRTLVEHWTGAGWSIATTPNPATGTNTFDYFDSAAVVPGANQVWAVGTEGPARPANGAEFTFAARRN